MNREELIEEAAKAMWRSNRPSSLNEDQWDATWDTSVYAYKALSLAALAVFEQAHTPTTPTDDEVHMLGDLIEHVQTTWEADRDQYIEPLADFTARGILAAGLRRTVQGEPSYRQERLDQIVSLINAADDGDEPPTLREIYLIAQGRA